MKQLYSTKNVDVSDKQRKILLAVYFIVAAILLAGIATCIIVYANEPFGTTLRTPLMVIMFVLAVVLIIFSFFYFRLVYEPVKKYVHFLKYTVFGKRDTVSLTVLDFYYQQQEYRGLDYYRISTLEWNEVRKDFVERIVLVDVHIDLEDVAVGDIITCQLANSCLVAYSKEQYEKNWS